MGLACVVGMFGKFLDVYEKAPGAPEVLRGGGGEVWNLQYLD
jgi:hypothetical protein